jgi:hypothetical protein
MTNKLENELTRLPVFGRSTQLRPGTFAPPSPEILNQDDINDGWPPTKKICLPSRDQVNLDIRSDLNLVSTLEVPESIESAASFISWHSACR